MTRCPTSRRVVPRAAGVTSTSKTRSDERTPEGSSASVWIAGAYAWAFLLRQLRIADPMLLLTGSRSLLFFAGRFRHFVFFAQQLAQSLVSLELRLQHLESTGLL